VGVAPQARVVRLVEQRQVELRQVDHVDVEAAVPARPLGEPRRDRERRRGRGG
jgi:hypothetical protein